MNIYRLLAIVAIGLVGLNTVLAQSDKPEGYQLLVDVNFDDKTALEGFQMTDPSAWRIGENNGSRTLELFGASEYKPKVRSPRNIAMLNGRKFGSFILELDMKQTGREYGHRDLCLFFNMKDPANFYYVHMASVADPHAHNIFLVNDAPRVAIASRTTDGVDWGQGWHKVKIARNVEEGSIKVYFDDMDQPIMEAVDQHFDAGYIGFGSFDDTGMIDNIKIWGPEAKQADSFFPRR